MSVPPLVVVPAQTGTAFELSSGEILTVVAPEGSQVADLAFYSKADPRESFSSGRTIDYAESILLTTGAVLYSNRSNPMAQIVADDVGRHDCLLAPCSARMFQLLRGQNDHPSCHENLAMALRKYGIDPDDIGSTFNAFMNVDVTDGRIAILPPLSKPGSAILFESRMDLIIGLTACSSEYTNGGSCRPVAYVLGSAP